MRIVVRRARRKRVGILTGSGPDAGIDLFQKLLAANKRLVLAAEAGKLARRTVREPYWEGRDRRI